MDTQTIYIACILLGILTLCLWAFDFVNAWGTWNKIMINIFMIPICYGVAYWQVNK